MDGRIDLGSGNWWSLWLLMSPSIREFAATNSGGIVVTVVHGKETLEFLSPTGQLSDVVSALQQKTPKEYHETEKSKLD